MDGGLEELVGEIVLGEFVVGDIEPVASPFRSQGVFAGIRVRQ
jgi:hypothetical protein